MQHQENNRQSLTRQSRNERRERKQLRKLQMVLDAVEEIKPRQHPRMEVSDFGTMDEDELRDILTNGRVIWRRPGT